MKTRAVSFIFLILSVLLLKEVKAQTVQVCIKVNGTLMPASKTSSMCRKNVVTTTNFSSVTLAAANCAASPETNITIKWKNLSIAPYTDSTHSTIIAKDTGRWEATITNNVTLAVFKDTLHLVYYAPIGVSLNDAPYSSPSTEGCPLYDITLTATPSGAVTSYMWLSYSPGDTIEGQTGSSYTFKQKNKQYIVIAKDANTCSVADTTIYYSQNAFLISNVGPDPAIFCEGNTYSLNNTVPTGIIPPMGSHTMFYGINNTTLGSITVSGQGPNPTPIVVSPPAGSNRYWIRVQQFPYCSSADTVIITTRPIPVVSLGPSPLLACYAANTTLTPTVTSSTGTLSYVWSSSPASSLPSTSSISVSPTATTTYNVKVRDANNCGDGIANLVVNVNPQIFTTVSNDTTICKDPQGSASLVATASGGTGTLVYGWTPTTGLSSTNTLTTTATLLTSTTYTFTATDANNCPDSELVTVTSYEPAVAPIALPIIISETKNITLDASFSGNSGATFVWKTDTTSTILSSSSSLFLEYQGPDTVRYVVIVTDPSNGCVNKDTFAVWSISENTLMFVPNVFSPNASNPENQTLKIYGSNLLPDGFKWQIYNKWGNLMYESTNLAEVQSVGMDAGNMPEGVYTYFIVGKFKNGKDVKESPYYKGTFSLIR